MSDLDLTKKTNFTQNHNTGSSQSLKDQMADAGAEMKQRAGDALQASTDVARDKFKEAADTAKNVASGTADQIEDQARDKQRSGADFVERLAGNIREAARAFESDAPFAALGINSAAGYVDDAAEKIRNGSFRDLVDGATDFARRQAGSDRHPHSEATCHEHPERYQNEQGRPSNHLHAAGRCAIAVR